MNRSFLMRRVTVMAAVVSINEATGRDEQDHRRALESSVNEWTILKDEQTIESEVAP